MNAKKTIQQLEKAKSAIELAITNLKSSQAADAELVGECVFCNKKVYTPERMIRGLCESDYTLFNKQVKILKATTWKKLEEQGKCLPPGKVGRKALDVMAETFREERTSYRKKQK